MPGVFAKIHPSRRSPWVGLLFSAAVVCCAARGRARWRPTSRAATPDRAAVPGHGGVPAVHLRARDRLLPQAARPRRVGADLPRQHAAAVRRPARQRRDPRIRRRTTTPRRCSGAPACVAVGVVLFLIEYLFGKRNRRPAPNAGTRPPREQEPDMHVIVATDGSKQSLAAAKPSEVVRRPDQDHRHLGGRRDPAAGRGRLRRRPVQRRPAQGRHRGRQLPGAPPRTRSTWSPPSSTAGDRRCTARSAAGRRPTRSSRPPSSSGRPRGRRRRRARDQRRGAGRQSTAQRVQHYAPCPVLVVRPAPQRQAGRSERGTRLISRLPPWRHCGWSCSSCTCSASPPSSAA